MSPIERALPIIYRSDDPKNMNYVVSMNAQDQTVEAVAQKCIVFEKDMKRLITLCTISAHPYNICGRRTNCCGCSMKSLFHESK